MGLENCDEEEEDYVPAIAIVGRPNIGKSSILNALVGEDRTIVSPISGTTHDAIDTEFSGSDGQIGLIEDKIDWTAKLRLEKFKGQENLFEGYKAIITFTQPGNNRSLRKGDQRRHKKRSGKNINVAIRNGPDSVKL
ncbi:gtpase der [Quercus suber]|uniref:Gtpase der n=1 Tax=Quercus suber TaxID=58331 RepID=A0AAW0KMZ0_QUESU